jgi:hypothetical protein
MASIVIRNEMPRVTGYQGMKIRLNPQGSPEGAEMVLSDEQVALLKADKVFHGDVTFKRVTLIGADPKTFFGVPAPVKDGTPPLPSELAAPAADTNGEAPPPKTKKFKPAG